MASSHPTSLQESFALLYRSSELGVAMANEGQIIDANDAFLKMVGYTRLELTGGEIDWMGMTPPEYRVHDRNAIQQLREYGVCVPFEKEFTLRDGTRLPFMIGAVRLTAEPLSWAAYIVNLSAQRKASVAEQRARDLQGKTEFINQLAHEINNPLAALTFLLHLLSTRPDVNTAESKNLLAQANEQLARVSHVIGEVLTISEDGDKSSR